ncbi:headcase protein-like [Saccostrea echinata]|nr:headcase protein-like [Saccostrea echinata]
MPHQKHFKNQKGKREDTNNNVQQIGHDRNANVHAAQNGHQQTHVACCTPSTCLTPDELIDPSDPGDAVRVYCNNDQCTMGIWMHGNCFIDWEETVLAYLKSCGRARSWSEKQRLQNLWTKKGYDLAFKACDCKCGRGHIRKDLNYVPPPKPVDNAVKSKKKHKKKNDKPMAVVSNGKPGHTSAVNSNHGPSAPVNINHINNINNNTVIATSPSNSSNSTFSSSLPARSSPINTPLVNGFAHMRLRTNSCESTVSTGSSPPNSAGSTGSASPIPQSPVINGNFMFSKQQKPKFDNPSESTLQAGAYFRRRVDMSAFNILPKHKQNPYHIKMEEDSQGNDETRSFVLTHLSSYKVSSLNCVLCKTVLPVFDRYPMIDGTFFLSPQAYDESVVRVISDGRLQFINAVCVGCLEGGSDICCAACKKKWDGSTLLLGTMYSYDIFAAMPCCQKRLTCKHCRRAVVDVNTGLSFYSEYSRMITCPYCKAYDYHFIRPMSDTFVVKQPIWN